MDVFNYALIKYCPNKETGEFVVVGYVAEQEKGRRTAISMHESLFSCDKLQHMFGSSHHDIYHALAGRFLREVERYARLWKIDEECKVESPLQRYAQPTNDPMCLSNSRAIMGDDIYSVSKELRERYVL